MVLGVGRVQIASDQGEGPYSTVRERGGCLDFQGFKVNFRQS